MMIHNTSQKPGYILVLCIMMLGAIVVVITTLSNRTINHGYFDTMMVDMSKAHLLAWSGVELAMNQLVIEKKEKKADEQKTDQKVEQKNAKASSEKKEDPYIDFLLRVVPVLNKWQTFKLEQKIDGMDAKIEICIACEEGKFDINAWYNFDKHEFISSDTQVREITTLFSKIQNVKTEKNLFEPFAQFLKKEDYPLDDATALLAQKDFQQAFKRTLFYAPLSKEKTKEKARVYLTDIFTTFSTKKTINPWFFSHSMATLFDVTLPQEPAETLKKQLSELLKNNAPLGETETVWNTIFVKLYNKEFKNIAKELVPLLDTKAQPNYFSVLSRATVGTMSQQLLAILQRQEDAIFVIRKIYQL